MQLLGDDDFLAGTQHLGEIPDVFDVGVSVKDRQGWQRIAIGRTQGRLEFGDAIQILDLLADFPGRINNVVDRAIARLATEPCGTHPQAGLASAVDLPRQLRQILADAEPLGQLNREHAVRREVDDLLPHLQAQRLLDDHLPAFDGDKLQRIGLWMRVDRLDLTNLDNKRAHDSTSPDLGPRSSNLRFFSEPIPPHKVRADRIFVTVSRQRPSSLVETANNDLQRDRGAVVDVST